MWIKAERGFRFGIGSIKEVRRLTFIRLKDFVLLFYRA